MAFASECVNVGCDGERLWLPLHLKSRGQTTSVTPHNPPLRFASVADETKIVNDVHVVFLVLNLMTTPRNSLCVDSTHTLQLSTDTGHTRPGEQANTGCG